MKRTLLRAILVAVLTLPGLVACSDGLPERVPVSGRVTIDGKPLTVGSVRFLPPSGRPAVGEVDAEGRFVLTTFGEDDGCVLGTHQVTVHALEALGGNAQRWNVPKKYATPETSGLTESIGGPRDDVLIELSWNGGGPVIERFEGE